LLVEVVVGRAQRELVQQDCRVAVGVLQTLVDTIQFIFPPGRE
jgi:hypothetical protein